MEDHRKGSDPEEIAAHDTKVSDSGYSNSCSNSQSQRSSGSLESRHSSSSGSSGYCGHPSSHGNKNDNLDQGPKRKEKEHKKKKSKSTTSTRVEELKAPPELSINAPKQPQTKEGENVLSGIAKPPTGDSEALQMAALTQTLTCIKKLKSKEISDDLTHDNPPCKFAIENHEQIIKYLQAEFVHADGLYVVVSLKDGIILYTSPNLTDLLGYPKDMWVGRSLIDFVYPKHRIAFASHITSVIAQPPETACVKRSSFSCCLRQYRGLKSAGFTVTNKQVSYLPCQLTTSFREVSSSDDPNSYNKIYLVITASALKSAYKYGDEKVGGKFMTRHLASSHLSHIDQDATPFLGYLPQDIVGRSIFDFYHPEDLPLMKEIYQDVIKEHGHLLRSKPYRFKCQNGGYVLLETEWSSFINPWSRKLEFIIGQHTVLRGPANPDVTTPVIEEEQVTLSEELLKATKTLQDEIKCILNETIGVQSREAVKQVVTKRCKDLANFMETLMDSKPADLKVDVLAEDHSISERDSVMLGEISPHHEYYNSKASSETPPSYNQLNYNENLQRFFESQPKTTLSDESNSDTKGGGAPASGSSGNSKKSPIINSSNASEQRPCCSTNNMSGTSSGQSTESTSNGNSGGEANEMNNNSNQYHPPKLTEQILTKHNEDMEKQMMEKHRMQRSKSEKSKDRHKSLEKHKEENGAHQGTKRSLPLSWEAEPFKVMKHTHRTGNGPVPPGPQQNLVGPNIAQPKLNLWPPFPVGVPLQQRTFPTPALANPIVPMYHPIVPSYAEPHTENVPTFQTSTYIAPPVQFHMPGMMYHPLMIGAPPVMYSPLTVLPSPIFPSTQPMKPLSVQRPAGSGETVVGPSNPQVGGGGGPGEGGVGGSGGNGTGVGGGSLTGRGGESRGDRSVGVEVGSTDVRGSGGPASQATSVKAEPGSALCSIASASLQQALSDKAKSVSSPEHNVLSPQPDEKKAEHEGDTNTSSNIYDDSSIYSSFYSFLRTDKSDESMKSSPENDSKNEYGVWEKAGKLSRGRRRTIKKVAPWLEDINVTQELVLKYQLQERKLSDVLSEDSKALERITQPGLVNDQLTQMYIDLELEGLSKHLTLEEGITSSSDSSGDDVRPNLVQKIKKKKYMEYDKMSILFEENAPMPPPASVNS